MTIGGWILFSIIAICLIAFSVGVALMISEDTKGIPWGLLIGLILSAIVFGLFDWYYGNTASGARAMKSQESNFNMGIERKVTVYDVEGKVIKEYEGKFDLEYDDDRILFDDEKGLRHIIYYPTGTVIIDEVSK